MHLKPYYSEELMNFLKQEGAVLAMEEFNHIFWPPLDPEQPFLSLARKTLSHFAFKPVSERIRVMEELARKYRVDGIVHFSHHGCRTSCGGALIIKEASAGGRMAGPGPGGRLPGWKERGLRRNADTYPGIPGDIAGKEARGRITITAGIN